MITEIVSIANAEHDYRHGNYDAWHLLKTGTLSVVQRWIPPHGAETNHYHEKAHQFFFILSGQGTLEIDNQRLLVRAHEGVSVPPKVPHTIRNETDVDLSFLVISSPTSLGDRIAAE
jgi:mannose-6-phosphate isomerase-like protein (cupin superfamily)